MFEWHSGNEVIKSGSESSYFEDSDLLLPHFLPGGNNNKNRSELFRDSKKWEQYSFQKTRFSEKLYEIYHSILIQSLPLYYVN